MGRKVRRKEWNSTWSSLFCLLLFIEAKSSLLPLLLRSYTAVIRHYVPWSNYYDYQRRRREKIVEKKIGGERKRNCAKKNYQDTLVEKCSLVQREREREGMKEAWNGCLRVLLFSFTWFLPFPLLLSLASSFHSICSMDQMNGSFPYNLWLSLQYEDIYFFLYFLRLKKRWNESDVLIIHSFPFFIFRLENVPSNPCNSIKFFSLPSSSQSWEDE